MKTLIEKKTCDKCIKEIQTGLQHTSFSVGLGRCVGASGNTERKSIDFDLCVPCQSFFLKNLLDNIEDKWHREDVIKKFVPQSQVYDS